MRKFSEDYNLENGEDLEVAVKYKKYIMVIFFIIIISPLLIIYGVDFQSISQTVRNTTVKQIKKKELENKLKYNEIDEYLVIITRNDDENIQYVFKYIMLYFEKLANGGEIYYFDDSKEYINSKNGHQAEFDKMKENFHYEEPITFYLVNKKKVSQIQSFNIDFSFESKADSINRKILLQREIISAYLSLDRIYGVDLTEKLTKNISNSIFKMELEKIKSENAVADDN